MNARGAPLLHVPVADEDLVRRIEIEDPHHIPLIVLCIAPCRSGTTASLRVYAESGVGAYSQPIKGILRHLAKGKPAECCTWRIPAADYLYVKETSGPFNERESTLDPLAIMRRVLRRTAAEATSDDTDDLATHALELARKRLHVVIMGREPHDTWHSWEAAFHQVLKGVTPEERWYYAITRATLFRCFILAFHNVEAIRLAAQRSGISLTHYVAEANAHSERAFQALFDRIGWRVSPKTSGWTSRSVLGGHASKVVLTVDHSTQHRAGLFDKVNASTGLRFAQGRGQQLTSHDRAAIIQAGLPDIYERWRRATEEDLQLHISPNGRRYSTSHTRSPKPGDRATERA
jgi:hypothetical protein